MTRMWLNTAKKVTRKGFLFIVATVFFGASIAHAEVALQSAIKLETLPAHSRLILSFDDSFQFQWKDQPSGFVLTIPTASLMDLGIPFGLEHELNAHLKSISDSRLKQVHISESEGGVKIEGQWRFPVGAQALANPAMEHFDFRQKETGKFVLDFWYKKGPTKAEVDRKKNSEVELAKKQELLEKKRKEEEREAQRQAKIDDSKNALAFCSRPFDKSNTVFLRFRPDHPRISFQNFFPENVPDHRYEYAIPKGITEEEQMVQLAVKLYRENKHGLAIKTVEFVFKEYPKSKYKLDLQFLNANAHFRLGFEDKALQMLAGISKEGRGTEVGLQSAAFLAIRYYRSKEWLAALDSFLKIQREFPNHPMAWLFRYGTADCLYQIRQSDRALEEFNWVAENAPKDTIKAEAAFKAGNVYFDRNQFAHAIQAYSESIKKYSKNISSNPFAVLNLAESYFQLSEVNRAQAEFEHYLELAPANPASWRASLRIAEIKAMKAQTIDSENYMEAFRETINRYPLTPGTTIARMRLLPCGDHGGFDIGSMQRFFESKEIEEFSSNEAINGNQFSELLGLTELRSWLAFNEDERAIRRGMFHLQHNPSLNVRKLLEAGVLSAVKRLLTNNIDHANYFAAMESFEKYGDLLPIPGVDPVADQIRVQLSKFAAEKGMAKVVKKITEPYQVSDTKWNKVVTQKEAAEQEDRLLAEVKSSWNSQTGVPADLLKKLGQVQDGTTRSNDRNILEALILSKDKKHEEAFSKIQLAVKAGTVEGKNAKFTLNLLSADLAHKAEKTDDEIQFVRAAQELLKKDKTAAKERHSIGISGLPVAATAEQLVIREGSLLEDQGRVKEALDCYTKAIENKISGNRILYSHAQALLKLGDPSSRKRAIASLESITDGYWKTLAQKVLDEVKAEKTNAKEGNP